MTKKPTFHFPSIHQECRVFSLKDVEQNFPLAAVCINITKMVMDALQTGHLANLEAPDAGKPRVWLGRLEVMVVVNRFCAHSRDTVYHFGKGKTMEDIQF